MATLRELLSLQRSPLKARTSFFQTKANRLSMNLIGQAIVSKKLMEKFETKSIRSIAICSEGDSVLEQYLAKYGIELVVYG